MLSEDHLSGTGHQKVPTLLTCLVVVVHSVMFDSL